MARTRSESPPPPYTLTPPIISGPRAFFPTPPGPGRTASSSPPKSVVVQVRFATCDDHERTPLLAHREDESRRCPREIAEAIVSTIGGILVGLCGVAVVIGFAIGLVYAGIGLIHLLGWLFSHLVYAGIGLIHLLGRLFSRLTQHAPIPIFNIAIIGAGPAGIAAAQHLLTSSDARRVKLNITLFESKPIVGGALALYDTAKESAVFPSYDLMQSPITAEDIAGPALMWNNALFTRDSQKILGDSVNFFELSSGWVGYYDNTHKITSLVRPYKKMPFLPWLGLYLAYGSSIWDANKMALDGILRNKIMRAPLVPDIEAIFKSLGLLEPLRLPADDVLSKRAISGKYRNEILGPQVQRAYGQSLHQVTGLAVMLAAAQEETANLYTGGDLVERLQRIVDHFDLNVRTSTRVTEIKHVGPSEEHPAWLIRHKSTEEGSDGNLTTEAFDKVIMAAFDMGLQLENDEGVALNLTSYHENDMDSSEDAMLAETSSIPLHITFFTSGKKVSSWGGDHQALFLDANKADGMREVELVREIFTTHTPTPEYLYRVISNSPVLDTLQRHAPITWSYQTTIDKAYPLMFPISGSFPPFELPWAKGFWWTSIIEHAGATVDLSWLAGKVVAEALIREIR